MRYTNSSVFDRAAHGRYLDGKKIVEYTFKNSLSSKVQTVILNPNHLTLQSAVEEVCVPYQNIRTVRLSKHHDTFKITLIPNKQNPISITNKYFLPNGTCEDRSRQYTAFVRVLHYHLNSHGKPLYSSGFSLNLLVMWVLISAFISFFISFVSEYLGLSLMNPFVQALVLTTVLVAAVLIIQHGRIPRTYSPTEIPYQFLP